MAIRTPSILRTFAALGLCGLSLGTWAQEQARVLSSTPIVQQVRTQQRVCNQVPVEVTEPRTGAGAVLGAVVGGAVGSAVGAGAGNVAATALGVVGGAVLGDRLEADNRRVVNGLDCTVQDQVQSVAAYQVVYEYAGKSYTVQMPKDPGPFVTVQVTPVVAGALPPGAPAAPAADPAVTSARTVVVVPQGYVAPYPYLYPYVVAPLTVGGGWVFHRHGGRRWR